ncbi:MAG: 4-vinyl reductase [Anaerolineales bacterium]|nr:4-vinyl reductase [Anaerolineales bacterium]
MKITPKSQPDPVSNIKIHDGSFRWALQAAEEVAGKQGLVVTLKQAGLGHLIDNFPENVSQVSGKYSLGEYGKFNVGLLNFFGRGGRSMLMRIGRISNKLGSEQLSAALGNAILTALRVLPEGARTKKGLELVKFGMEKFFVYQGVQPLVMSVEERGDKVTFKLETCGCCCGFESDSPICYMWTGYFQEGLRGLFGKDREVEVREVECRAMGAPACVFEMSKLPVDS